MAKYKSMVITNNGLKVISAAQTGDTITFTAIKSGSGVYDGTEALSAMTDLKEVKQTFGITGITRSDSTTIKVRTVFNNEELAEGYSITEIGLFAKDPETDMETLYAIIIAEAGFEDYLPAYADAPTTITQEIFQNVSNIDSGVVFKAEIIDGTYVTVQDFEDHRNEMNTKIDTVTREAAEALETGLAGKTTHIDLKGQLQVGGYKRSVIALCNTSPAKTVVNSYTDGRIMLTKNGGDISTKATIDIFASGSYYLANNIDVVIRTSTQLSTAIIKPCTFSYNGVIYGGLDISITANDSDVITFDGSTNFGIFGLDYLVTNTNKILNEEVYNSINYDNVTWLANNTLNGEQIVRESELIEVNGKGEQLTTSVLDKALALDIGVYNYFLGGENCTDYDYLPNKVYRYGSATIYKRRANVISVVFWGMQIGGVYYPPVTICYDATGWSGWKTLATTEDLANYYTVDKVDSKLAGKVTNNNPSANAIALEWNGNIEDCQLFVDATRIGRLITDRRMNWTEVVNTNISDTYEHGAFLTAWEYMICYVSNGTVYDTAYLPLNTIVANSDIKLRDANGNISANVNVSPLMSRIKVTNENTDYYVVIYRRGV